MITRTMDENDGGRRGQETMVTEEDEDKADGRGSAQSTLAARVRMTSRSYLARHTCGPPQYVSHKRGELYKSERPTTECGRQLPT